MVDAEPEVVVELDPRARRAEIAAGVAAGMVAQPRRRIGLGREYGSIGDAASHPVWEAAVA